MSVAAATPWILGGLGAASVGSSLLRGRPSSSERAALEAATAATQQARQQGAQLFQLGFPPLQRTGTFFSRLLSGDRGVLAPEAAEITERAAGEARTLEQLGVRGGARDVALADVARRQSTALANLLPQARLGAAGSLANLGLGTVGAGQAGTGQAATAFAQLLQSLQRARLGQAELGLQAGRDIGGLIFDLLLATQGRQAGRFGSAIPGLIATPPR